MKRLTPEQRAKLKVATFCNLLVERDLKILNLIFESSGEQVRTFKDIESFFDVSYERIANLSKRALERLNNNPCLGYVCCNIYANLLLSKINMLFYDTNTACFLKKSLIKDAVHPEDNYSLKHEMYFAINNLHLTEKLCISLNDTEREEYKVLPTYEKSRNILNDKVYHLELTIRSCNCLEKANIITVKDLIKKTPADLLKIKDFGKKCLNEVIETLSIYDLSLGMKLDEKEQSL